MILVLFTVKRPIAKALHEGGAYDLTEFFNEHVVVPAFRNPRLRANNSRHREFCDMEARVPTEATQQFIKALAERPEVETIVFQVHANTATFDLSLHFGSHPHKKIEMI